MRISGASESDNDSYDTPVLDAANTVDLMHDITVASTSQSDADTALVSSFMHYRILRCSAHIIN